MGLLSGLFSSISTGMTNAANLKATDMTNRANLAIAKQTNQTAINLAQQANDLSRELAEQQNTWNIEQWNRENEYNSPEQQVERYIKAGINPMWAISGMNPGNAQHLEAASPSAPVTPNLSTPNLQANRYLPPDLSGFETIPQNVNNAARTFLESLDVKTRRSAQQSRANYESAMAAEAHARTTGIELENEWSLATLDTRIHEERQKLENLRSQFDVNKATKAEKEAHTLLMNESKNLVSQQITESIARIEQRDYELYLMERGQKIDAYNAETQRKAYDLQSERLGYELQQWNNQNILQFMSKFGRTLTGEMSGKVGIDGFGVSGRAGLRETTPADVKKMKAGGLIILQRAADYPTDSNLKDAEEASKYLKLIEQSQERNSVVPVDKLFNSSKSSIVNPYYPSESWSE